MGNSSPILVGGSPQQRSPTTLLAGPAPALQVVRGPKLAPAGRQEILTGLRKEVVTMGSTSTLGSTSTMGSTSTLGSVTTLGNRQPDGLAQRGVKQEIVTAPRQVFYTSGTR